MNFIPAIDSSPPYILAAPLCGYTNSPYRKILHCFSYDLIFTEMISVDALYYGNEKTSFLYHTSTEQNRLGIQLFGSQPDRFLHAVHKLSTLHPFKVFDLNCGCPVAKVTKTGGGAALLKDPEMIYRILSSLKAEFPDLMFSAKIRLGISPKIPLYREVSQAIQEGGAQFLTIHGRAQSQFYSGDVDYSAIREIKQSSRIPIIGNGGIFEPEDAYRFLEQTGVDGIMIARGLIGAPWIVDHIREYRDKMSYTPLSWEEKIAIMKKHFTYENQFSPEYGFQNFKKSALAYLKGLPHSKTLRIKLATASCAQEMEALLEDLPDTLSMADESVTL